MTSLGRVARAVLGVPLLLVACQAAPLGPGEIMSLDLGTGTDQCEISGQSRTFAPDEPVYVVTTFESALPAGTTVRYDIEYLGSTIYTDSERLATDASCISFPILEPPLSPGHYKVTVSPDTGPPISGEFDVAG